MPSIKMEVDCIEICHRPEAPKDINSPRHIIVQIHSIELKKEILKEREALKKLEYISTKI